MPTRYILLPARGIRPNPVQRDLFRQVFDLGLPGLPIDLPTVPIGKFSLIDTVSEDGPKLVEMTDEVADAINQSPIPLRAVPEVILRHPLPYPHLPTTLVRTAAGTAVTVHCEEAGSHQPLAGQQVVAFDDFAQRSGDSGVTNAQGDVILSLANNRIDRLFVLSSDSHWGAYRENLVPVGPLALSISPLAPTDRDSIRRMYPARRFAPATGVRVGIVDTGVGPHRDLSIEGGLCTVTGSPATAYADIDIHGTHVAGLIGGNGGLGDATLGLAPGVALRAYRVFDYYDGELGASNYAILKATIFAANQGCDIVNLSLGGGPADPIVQESIIDARNQGMLVVIAAGNDLRSAVSYPAAYAGATAVSAMGRTDGYPAGCYFAGDVMHPPNGADALEYLAGFSNVGPQIACTGLGSGVLSTLPNDRFGPLSGTSMAAPMVAGAAASLLSQDAAVYGMPRDRARSDAMERLLQTSCVQHFGGGIWEGYGLPNPLRV